MINRNQRGFVPGRNTNQNINDVLKVMNHYQITKGKSTIVFFIDFKKAYDSVDHEILE
jgi:hypothetical protein